MNTDDEWNAEPAAKTLPPGSVRAAGIVWMVVGVFFILSGCGNFVLSVVLAAERGGGDGGSGVNAVWLSLGIGFGFFMSGRNIVRGKAKDVLGVAVMSIIIAVIYFAIGFGFAALAAADELLVLIVVGVCAVTALGCLLPAILALSGRSQYRVWRRANPWDEDEEDDEEDDDRRDEEDERGPDKRPWDRGRR